MATPPGTDFDITHGCWSFVSPSALIPGDMIIVDPNQQAATLVTAVARAAGGYLVDLDGADLLDDIQPEGHFLPAHGLVLRRSDGIDSRTQGFLAWLVALDDPLDVLGQAERRRVTLTKITDRAAELLAADDNPLGRRQAGLEHLEAERSALTSSLGVPRPTSLPGS